MINFGHCKSLMICLGQDHQQHPAAVFTGGLRRGGGMWLLMLALITGDSRHVTHYTLHTTTDKRHLLKNINVCFVLIIIISIYLFYCCYYLHMSGNAVSPVCRTFLQCLCRKFFPFYGCASINPELHVCCLTKDQQLHDIHPSMCKYICMAARFFIRHSFPQPLIIRAGR